jgi:hypothetical protein
MAPVRSTNSVLLSSSLITITWILAFSSLPLTPSPYSPEIYIFIYIRLLTGTSENPLGKEVHARAGKTGRKNETVAK